jgi:predicted short-subunit dehydrogenase-like oxidoreductase (DUF2520 family)
MSIRTAAIIGSGNVATQLGTALRQAGVHIDVVYSRNPEHAQRLAAQLGALPYSDLSLVPGHADLYLIAVSDTAIRTVSDALGINDGIVVHTSGITPMSALAGHRRIGVFYPLQTITRNTAPDFRSMPLLIEANNASDEQALNGLAAKISGHVSVLTSEQRQYVHLAAVFANNFSNHMYAVAEQIAQAYRIPFDILKPLILETARKVQELPPQAVQTGPAIRNDITTIEKHLMLLKRTPEFRQIYELMSRSIRSLHESSSGKEA